MRWIGLVLLMTTVACHAGPRLQAPFADLPGIPAAPPVLNGRAAVLFWLSSADTLSADSIAVAIEHLQSTARDLGPLLAEVDIALFATNASRLIIGGPGRPQRPVSLAGLDYPWGVVLVDPGYPEQIITGPVDAAALEDLVWAYFDLEESRTTPADHRVARFLQSGWVAYRLSDRQTR